MIGPRKQGSFQFRGMDLSLAPTVQDPATAELDQGGNHEVQARWATRRGWQRAGYGKFNSKITAVATWVGLNGLTACLIADATGYYPCVPVAFPAGGYGTGGYGTQDYGS